MQKLIRSLFLVAVAAFGLSSCDLQPKIAALPDTVGEFISARYPAMLADPETQPEIYNSAVTDYGVYASPELYGTSDVDDYLLYSSVDDYTLKSQPQPTVPVVEYGGQAVIAAPATVDDYLVVPAYEMVRFDTTEVITIAKGETLYSISRKYSVSVGELAAMNNLSEPYALNVGQKIKVPVTKEVPIVTISTEPAPVVVAPVMATPVKAEVAEITVAKGETLYSISRKYATPVNDLAVMNNLSSPFTLSVGQKLKVPKITDVALPDKTVIPVRTAVTPVVTAPPAPTQIYGTPTAPTLTTPKAPTSVKLATPVVAQPKEKVSSAPTAPLPKIASRSSSKFSWPVRGKILSSYGAKSNGLFNDGINISASSGTKVGAAENGVIAYAGNELKGMGNLIIVQHSDGWMTVYAHMDKLSVRRGVKVTVGQQIGTVGQTGKVDKPQLHFEIRKGAKAYDPSAYLKK